MPTKAELAEHRRHQREWREFCERYLYTQRALAAALGISRRTVQYVMGGRKDKNWPCIPSVETQAKFRALRAKVEVESKRKAK